MKTLKLIALLTLSVISQLALAQASKGKFYSKDGRFKISFAVEPKTQSQMIDTEAGKIEMFTFMYEKSATEAYMVAYADYPSELIKKSKTKDLIAGAKNGVLKNLNSKVTEEKAIKLGNYEGLQFKAKGVENEFYLAYKMYLVKNRLYQIAILRDGGSPTEESIKSFLNSFELVN